MSTQVLHEYYVNVTGKLRPGLPVDEARADIRALTAWGPRPADDHTISSAWDIQDEHGLNHWDALIVASAMEMSCRYLLTEDLQDGQDLGGVLVVDPFLHPPGSLD